MGQPLGRLIWFDVQREVDLLVRPQAGHGHDPVVDFAQRAQILAGDVGRFRAVFAVPGLIDDQHALVVRLGRRIGAEHGQPLLGHQRDVPGGLRQEELQRLNGRRLGLGGRFGAGHGRHRFVPIPGQKQPLHIVAKAAPLGHIAEERVKERGIILQRPRGGRRGTRSVMGAPPPPFYPSSSRVQQSNVRTGSAAESRGRE